MRSCRAIALGGLGLAAALGAVVASGGLARDLASAAGAGVDPARLPVGDGRVSTAARRGFVFACPGPGGGGGAQAAGPWFNGDGTWDATRKAVVAGAVGWPQAARARRVVGRSLVLSGNGLPDHATGAYPIATTDPAYQYDRNPNTIRAQADRITVPAGPRVASRPSCLGGSTIGVALNGVSIYSALDAASRDAAAWEVQDACQGHPDPTGRYHYHSIPGCLTGAGSAAGHSPQVGYALDGFGIFGPRGEGGRRLTNADLDACHGHTHIVVIRGRRQRVYHYHATAEYPYTLGCYRGTPARTGAAPGPPPG